MMRSAYGARLEACRTIDAAIKLTPEQEEEIAAERRAVERDRPANLALGPILKSSTVDPSARLIVRVSAPFGCLSTGCFRRKPPLQFHEP